MSQSAAPRAGIVGSGQLSQMLVDAAQRLGRPVAVLAASPDEPAAQRPWAALTFGSFTDPATLAAFLGGLAYATFDQELVTPRPFQTALAQLTAAGKVPVMVPDAAALLLCSDKLAQKRRLHAAGLPTPPWLEWESGAEPARAWLARVAAELASGAVIKVARGGYDGRGTFAVRDWGDEATVAAAAAFCERAAKGETPVYAEAFVPFVAELAVVSTRWADGRFVQYPTVRTRQDGGVCAEVRGPAAALGMPAELAREAEMLAARIGAEIGLTGTYAVEMFLTRDGRLEVNEIAPRVHNSGHFTQDAAETSQFENHWRAVYGLESGATKTAPFFAMVNVLGTIEADLAAAPPFAEIAAAVPGAVAHWYGKRASRPGRKLGHVNLAAASADELERKLAAVWAAVDEWRGKLARKG